MTGNPPRVLHVAQPVDGGVGRVVEQLVGDQLRRGWDVQVACPAHGELPHRARAAGAAVLPWDARRGARAGGPARVRALGRLVAEVAPDAVHLHSASAGLTGRLALRRRLPTVFQPHGWSWQAADGAFARATKGWEAAGQLLCHRIVCVSEAERRAGARAGIRTGVVVVPNGVDLAAFPPGDDAARTTARGVLGLPDVPLVVCVGRLDDQKGQAVLVRAWPRVLERVPTAVLALVGAGPAGPALSELATALGVGAAVLQPGAQPQVAPWYAAADVVAFPSRHGEAMALTPLEAQASARALVASDVAGVRESLGSGAGEVVPPGDPAALADALVPRLLDPSLAAREGAAGRRHAERSLDLEQATSAIAVLTLSLLDAATGR